MRKIDFQDGGHLDFPNDTIFYVQIARCFTQFQVGWPFGIEEAKNIFL